MLFGRKQRSIARLLVVEDEPLIAFDTERMLREHGYEVIATVDRVADARREIASATEKVDLILADVQLADGSGVEVARAASERSIPVMFVTSACPPEARALAVGFLAKPFLERDLLNAIEAVDAAMAGKATKRLPQGFELYVPIA
ncbi:response regulator [Sphingomonas sp. HHU CXW]|uniref:Response regulator n=1 Tax=Sphingomonas hominis TaxID=2741495 RepID=A0ABX2JKX3_9SPHN|nr:response regulator [Sphingomonas hominis]NTS64495.1 response regulator [Sphingomonas hominis]